MIPIALASSLEEDRKSDAYFTYYIKKPFLTRLGLIDPSLRPSQFVVTRDRERELRGLANAQYLDSSMCIVKVENELDGLKYRVGDFFNMNNSESISVVVRVNAEMTYLPFKLEKNR